MIDREHDLPITKQAKVLRISRGSVYYLPRPVSATDLEVMRRLDRLHLEFPFAGSRMLQGLLSADGCEIGRRHVKTLMRRMGIEALYRRPRTTKPEPGHKIYLHQPLRKLESARDIALGITEDFVAEFRAPHDIAGNGALKELEVAVNCRSHLLQTILGDLAHVGGDLELWCRAHRSCTPLRGLRVPTKPAIEAGVPTGHT